MILNSNFLKIHTYAGSGSGAGINYLSLGQLISKGLLSVIVWTKKPMKDFCPSQSYIYQVCTLNIDLILWHTQLIVCAENVKSWGFPLTFQAYILPHTLNCM